VDVPTLFHGNYSYKVTVPSGSARLDVRVASADPDVDVDLYVRRDTDTDLSEGYVVYDYVSARDGGNESLSITSASTPPLQPGTYWVSLVLYSTGTPAAGTVTATIARQADQTGTPIRSGQTARFAFQAVENPTLFNGANSYRIDVPDGASALEIRLATETPGVDVDLFAKYAEDVRVSGGRVVADFLSQGDSGDEFIRADAGTSPPLRAGTYYISLAVYTKSTAVTGTVSASVILGGKKVPLSLELRKGGGALKDKLREAAE
jgi:hypothetical protein